MPSVSTSPHESTATKGQVLALFALALFGVIGLVALVVEGGNVFGQQRIAQNGSDSAANAGAIVIAERLGGASRDSSHVTASIAAAATANGLGAHEADYTDGFGVVLAPVPSAGPIPATARGVQVRGERQVATSFARVLGINTMTAAASATAIAGAATGECVVEEDGCTLLPVTFPVKTFECDEQGNLLTGWWVGAPPPGSGGENYWPIVGVDDLPTESDPDGNTSTMAVLPLCRGSGESAGAFGWLEFEPGMNLAQEIEGPLTETVNIPDWFQSQTGNPNSVEDELSAYIHKPVLIPLHNGACRVDPGETSECPDPGVDPVGNNTWYYVHTLVVFYMHEVNVQGSDIDRCSSPPGQPLVPVTNGSGFLGCLKGWFIRYVTAGPIVPGNGPIPEGSAIGVQLIR